MAGDVALDDGFLVAPVAGTAAVDLTHQACEKTLTVLNPTPERMAWLKQSHRCRPGPSWTGQ